MTKVSPVIQDESGDARKQQRRRCPGASNAAERRLRFDLLAHLTLRDASGMGSLCRSVPFQPLRCLTSFSGWFALSREHVQHAFCISSARRLPYAATHQSGERILELAGAVAAKLIHERPALLRTGASALAAFLMARYGDAVVSGRNGLTLMASPSARVMPELETMEILKKPRLVAYGR
jgi:hypothetical protein